MCPKVIPDPPMFTSLRPTFSLGFDNVRTHQYNWSPPVSPIIGGIRGYNLSSTDSCGNCTRGLVSNDTFNAICTDWTPVGQICGFEVKTVTMDCGFVSEPIIAHIVFDSKCIIVYTYIIIA